MLFECSMVLTYENILSSFEKRNWKNKQRALMIKDQKIFLNEFANSL